MNIYTNFFCIYADGLSDDAKKFNRNLVPCCVSAYDNGYCGQRSPSGERLYELCENHDKFFYWDEMHPTNAGWKAVMKALEEPLKEFLDRDYVP
jgi:lysophospholipase L1-like esterase